MYHIILISQFRTFEGESGHGHGRLTLDAARWASRDMWYDIYINI